MSQAPTEPVAAYLKADASRARTRTASSSADERATERGLQTPFRDRLRELRARAAARSTKRVQKGAEGIVLLRPCCQAVRAGNRSRRETAVPVRGAAPPLDRGCGRHRAPGLLITRGSTGHRRIRSWRSTNARLSRCAMPRCYRAIPPVAGADARQLRHGRRTLVDDSDEATGEVVRPADPRQRAFHGTMNPIAGVTAVASAQGSSSGGSHAWRCRSRWGRPRIARLDSLPAGSPASFLVRQVS